MDLRTEILAGMQEVTTDIINYGTPVSYIGIYADITEILIYNLEDNNDAVEHLFNSNNFMDVCCTVFQLIDEFTTKEIERVVNKLLSE